MTMAEQLYEVGSKLPPSALAELADFAEFLQRKCAPVPTMRHRYLGGREVGWKTRQPSTIFPWQYRKKCAVNGIDYSLDTNFNLGLVKSSSDTLALINELQIELHQCAYSAIARMESLSFPGITRNEEAIVQERLACLTCVPVTSVIEDVAIRLRLTYRGKLPEAIIAASARAVGVELLSFDKALLWMVATELAAQAELR